MIYLKVKALEELLLLLKSKIEGYEASTIERLKSCYYMLLAKFPFYLICRTQIPFLIAIESIEWLPCLFISDVIGFHEGSMVCFRN